jgi:4-amino-4-deoxy-L-arabinose transferase-like glycosyltransferase
VILLLVLPAAVLAPWWSGQRPSAGWRAWYLRVGLATLAGIGIALAWAIPAALSGGPAYADAIFWGQTAGRMVESFAHARPFWWYLPLLPILLFPWLLWGGVWRGLKRLPLDAGARFCLAWVAPSFLAFSLISGKQVHYLLPLFPAFALLAARGLGRLDGQPSRADRAPLAILLLILASAFPLAPLLQDKVSELRWVASSSPLWGVLLALIAIGLLVHRPRHYRTQVWPMSLAVLAFLVALHIGPVRANRDAFDLAPMARHIAQLQDTHHPIAHLGQYRDEYQFLGRLTRPLEQIDDIGTLTGWLRTHPDGYVVARVSASMLATPLDSEYQQRYQDGGVGLWSARTLIERPELFGQREP